MKYLPLFLLIQLASLVLTVVGIPVVAILAGFQWVHFDHAEQTWHWPWWAWIWDNREDGVAPVWYQKAHPTWSTPRLVFTWAALRNSCNNLRYVPGVSKAGRPLWHRTWHMFGKQFYAQAGWLSDGYPCLSAGAGKGD